ncbi:hypothetical protein ACJX0J_021177, partial [Zea mays]
MSIAIFMGGAVIFFPIHFIEDFGFKYLQEALNVVCAHHMENVITSLQLFGQESGPKNFDCRGGERLGA